jgi:hypothetical protein
MSSNRVTRDTIAETVLPAITVHGTADALDRDIAEEVAAAIWGLLTDAPTARIDGFGRYEDIEGQFTDTWWVKFQLDAPPESAFLGVVALVLLDEGTQE